MAENAAADSNDRSRPLRRAREYLREKELALKACDGLSARWQFVVLLAALAGLVLRDSSLFTHAQFWAEDGKIWYAQAYNNGWLHSLAIPQAGYLSTVQRVGAGVAMLVPFRWAPLAMMCWGLLIQVLPVPILLSSRCARWAPLPMRIAFAVLYVAIPDAHEIHVVCTNSQWHLGVAELFVAFAAAPRSVSGRVFDVLVFTLGAVSGPFAILLIPFVALFWWVRRQQWSLTVLGILAAGSVLQLVILRYHQADRGLGFLGATPARFVRLLGGDVFTGALLGSRPYGLEQSFMLSLFMLLLGLAMCLYCFRFVSLEMRLFFVYCFALFVAELHNPLVHTTRPVWQVILEQGSLRYWFLPSLPFLFSVLWCAIAARSVFMRIAGVVLTLTLVRGIHRDWHIGPMKDMHFDRAVAALETAPAGAHIVIPLNPDPPGWQMELIKR